MRAVAVAVVLVMTLAACSGVPASSEATSSQGATNSEGEGAALPENLQDDPLAQLLGAEIVNAAIEEGEIQLYQDAGLVPLLEQRAKDFTDRFGIEIVDTQGDMRSYTDRIRTEQATGNQTADVALLNDQYMLELVDLDALVQYSPPAPRLAEIDDSWFLDVSDGYWSPFAVSPQALMVNTDLVAEEDYPTSYWDLLEPRWTECDCVMTRDNTVSAGGGWQWMHFSIHPDLGWEYIERVADELDPFIIQGGSSAAAEAIISGQFALGYSARGEFIRDNPDAPIAYIVPEEGFAWTPVSLAILADSPNPNAAKLFVNWMYEMEQLQVASDTYNVGAVPHPDIEFAIRERSLTDFPAMPPISPDTFLHANETFERMLELFRE